MCAGFKKWVAACVVWSGLFCGISTPLQAGDWRAQETTSADGTKITYYSRGSAEAGTPPLLIISGGPGSDQRYMRVGGALDMLARSRRILMFDQRGTSASGAVTGKPRLEQWTRDVEAVRQAANFEMLDLMGHSFGGFVVMDYMRMFPAHVRAVVFVNSMGPTLAGTKSLLGDIFPDRVEEWRRIRGNLSPRFKAGDISFFARMEFVDPRRAESFVAQVENYIYNIEVNNALREDMAAKDFSSVLRAFQGPALIVHGRFDAVIAPSTAWALHNALPASQIEILAETSHLPFAERPAAFAKIVDRFLAAAGDR